LKAKNENDEQPTTKKNPLRIERKSTNLNEMSPPSEMDSDAESSDSESRKSKDQGM